MFSIGMSCLCLSIECECVVVVPSNEWVSLSCCHVILQSHDLLPLCHGIIKIFEQTRRRRGRSKKIVSRLRYNYNLWIYCAWWWWLYVIHNGHQCLQLIHPRPSNGFMAWTVEWTWKCANLWNYCSSGDRNKSARWQRMQFISAVS